MRSHLHVRTDLPGQTEHEFYADLAKRECIGRSLDDEAAADADLLERVLIAELDDRSGWWPTETSEDGERS